MVGRGSNWRRARLGIFALLLAAGAAAGFVFDRVQLRGVAAPMPAEHTPTDATLAFAAGIEQLRRGDAHAAARAFEAARQANPHLPEPYLNLGFAYLDLGQPTAALAAFEQASQLAPAMPNTYFGIAEALEALGDLAGASGAMRTFLHLAPADDRFRRRAEAALWEWQAKREAAGESALPPAGLAPEAAALYTARLATLDRAEASLAPYRGRYLVLNVWASWCGPCRAELPSLDALGRQLDPARFAVVGVSIDQEPAFTREFLRELGIGLPSLWDGSGELTKKVLEVPAVPLTLIVSPEGRVLYRHEGARDWAAAPLAAAISGLAEPEGGFAARLARLKEVAG